jgi:hypothetical protein
MYKKTLTINQDKYLQVPEGWRLLKPHEAVSSTDQYAHLYEARWMPVSELEIGLMARKAAKYVITRAQAEIIK